MRRQVHVLHLAFVGAVALGAWSASDALAERSPHSSNATTAPASTVPRPTTTAAATTVPRPTTTAASTPVPTGVTTTPVVSTAAWVPVTANLLSGTHEQSTVFRSADGGATWQDVSGSLPEGIGYASSPLVLDAQSHLLGTNNGPASAVFRTTDGGATWTQVRAGGVLGAPLVVGGTISWLMAGGGRISTSTDGGLTWTETPANGAIDTYAAHRIDLPDGRLATIGQGSVIVSADGGVTWSPIGSPLPYTPNGLAYSPAQLAFYAWRFDCDFTTDNAIPADAIVRLDVDPGA